MTVYRFARTNIKRKNSDLMSCSCKNHGILWVARESNLTLCFRIMMLLAADWMEAIERILRGEQTSQDTLSIWAGVVRPKIAETLESKMWPTNRLNHRRTKQGRESRNMRLKRDRWLRQTQKIDILGVAACFLNCLVFWIFLEFFQKQLLVRCNGGSSAYASRFI